MTSSSSSINPMVDVVRAMIDSGHLTAADVQHLTEVAAQTGAGSAGAGVTLSEYVAQQLAALRHTKPSTHGTYNAPLVLLADGAHEICSCECEACTQPDNSPRGLPRGCPCRCGCEIDDDGRHHGQPVGRATTSGCTPECGSGACGARWTGVGHRALAAVTLTDLETAQHWTQVRAASVLRYRARRRSARGLSVPDHDGRGASENFVSACRWLLNRAVTEGLISRHAAMALKKPQRTDRTARALSESQLAELLHVADTTGFDPDGDRLCLLYFCQTAARFQGVLNSRYGYLDTNRSVIKINETKTKQIHTVAITPDLTTALHTHALQRGPRTPAPPDASPEQRRTGLPALTATDPLLYRPPVDTFDEHGYLVSRVTRPLTARSLDSLRARLRAHVDWAEQTCLRWHDFRHTLATALERTAGPAVAAFHLNHTNKANTTEIYTKATLEEDAAAIAAVFGTWHPLVHDLPIPPH